MKFYWALKDIPELKGLTAEERVRVINACYNQLSPWFNALLMGACMLASYTIVVGLGHYVLGFPFGLTFMLVVAATHPFLGILIYRKLIRNWLRPRYADYIQKERKPDAA